MILRKIPLLLVVTILITSCSLFSNSIKVIGEFESSDSISIYLDKGEYLLLEKNTTEKSSFDQLKVDIIKNDTIKITHLPSKKSSDAISGEAIIFEVGGEYFYLKSEIKILEAQEYNILSIGSKEKTRYIIINK